MEKIFTPANIFWNIIYLLGFIVLYNSNIVSHDTILIFYFIYSLISLIILFVGTVLSDTLAQKMMPYTWASGAGLLVIIIILFIRLFFNIKSKLNKFNKFLNNLFIKK